MRVEVIHDEHEFLSLGIVHIDQFADEMGKSPGSSDAR